MKLRTEIEIPKVSFQIAYSDRIALLGSCFSDNIARKLGEYYFQVTSNPTGTLYNPVSIARHIDDPEIRDADIFIITFGTSWIYMDKKISTVHTAQADRKNYQLSTVDNCEKRPASDFIRHRLTVDEIFDVWTPILQSHPDKRFIFTVSPIRHLKDGLHENNLSKAILLLAIEKLMTNDKRQMTNNYFPSYELLLDDLRDYRFYADDLMHPSSQAIEYIWERFVATYMSAVTQSEMSELHALWLNRQHRSLHPGSPEDQLFHSRLTEQLSALQSRFPWLK